MTEIRVEIRDFTDNILGDLDITSSENFPLSLSFQNFDIRNLSSRGGGFSKTFKIPATSNNNKLLNHIYRDGNSDVKNVRKDLPSTIYSDNLPIISGKLRVTQIYKNTEVLEYECVFLGDNMDWADSIKNLDLDELKFSSVAYTSYSSTMSEQPFTYGNPLSAAQFQAYKFNHDELIYPLITVGESDGLGNSTMDSDFIPCVYIKNVWDKIFQAQGYTVSSTFCDSNFFKNLCMPLIFQKRADVTDISFGRVDLTSDEVIHTFTADTQNKEDGESDFTTTNNRAIANPSITNNNYSLDFIMAGDNLSDDAESATDTTGNAQFGITHSSGKKNGLVVSSQGSGVFNIKASVTVSVSSDCSAANTNNILSYEFSGSLLGVYAKLVKIGTGDDVSDFTDIEGAQSQNYGSTSATLNPLNLNSTSQSSFTSSSTFGYFKYSFGQDSDGNQGNNQQDFTFNFDHETNLNANDKVALLINFVHTDNTEHPAVVTVKVKSGSFLEIQQTSAFFVGDSITSVGKLLPQGKQIDFVKGISQMFNLQYHTDVNTKTVFVEPYDHFYKDFDSATVHALDWTDKIDYSKNIKDEFLHQVKSRLILKYKDPSSDAMLDAYNKRNNVDWGSYEETFTDGRFQTGEFKIENSYFSPSFNWYEPNYVNFIRLDRTPVVPMYFTDVVDLSLSGGTERPEKEFKIGARILITSRNNSLGASTTYNSSNGKLVLHDHDGDGDPATLGSDAFTPKIARFISWDSLTVDLDPETNTIDTMQNPPTANLSQRQISNGYENVDFNLSFSDVTHNTVISTSANTLKGLYGLYYSKMIQQLKNNPRIKVMYINLKNNDISKLDFRNLVFIDGYYYRINKIIDYKPHSEESTKVELQEYFYLGASPVNSTINIDVENINI